MGDEQHEQEEEQTFGGHGEATVTEPEPTPEPVEEPAHEGAEEDDSE